MLFMVENSDYLEQRKRRTTAIFETMVSVWTRCVFVLDGQWKQAIRILFTAPPYITLFYWKTDTKTGFTEAKNK